MMDTINQILFTGFIFLLALEIWSYRRYVTAANALTTLGTAMQGAFEGVSKDVGSVNEVLTLLNLRVERLDEATDTLNSNDALIEIYLNLFRDALGLEADKLSRIGTLNFPNPKNSDFLGDKNSQVSPNAHVFTEGE